MDYFTILFWWSILGCIPYQLIVLRPMFKRNQQTITFVDFLKAAPFGFVILFAVSITKILMVRGALKQKE